MAKDIKNAAPRTQVYVRALTRAKGATATELKQAVIDANLPRRAEAKNVATMTQFTSHNSYSLTLLAATFGYAFLAVDNLKSDRTYFFRSPKNAEFFDRMIAEQAEEERNAKAEREAAKAAKQAAKAERDARKASKAATPPKASKAAEGERASV
jgi:hypothetical protein